MRVINPATEEVITDLPADDGAGIAQKYALALAAQPGWAATQVGDRIRAMEAFADALERETEYLAGILTDEMGKPLTQAVNEIRGTPERVRYLAGNVQAVLEDQRVLATEGMRETITHDPLGIVANISAWNYPYFVGTNVLVPALLTGNAVLYKPSEFTSMTGLEITRLLHESGIPEDAVIPVIGAGSTGAALMEQPLDAVFFTGSYATGRRVAAAAAEHLMKVQLELGGKDPAYVCDDADPREAATGLADGAFYNTGQSCCAVERLYVHADVHDVFVDAFVETVRGFTLGHPRDADVYIGPLTRHAQLDVLEAQVQDATDKGARILCGGKRVDRAGNFFQPTVLVDVTHDMAVMLEESFGPIIGIQKVRNDDEAAAFMNDTTYGLTASVYTPDEARARRVLAALDTGTVYWNCCDRVSPRLPWSGRRHSGIGSTLSLEGIRTFTRPKAWHLRG